MVNEGIINLAVDLTAGVQNFSEGDRNFGVAEATQSLREALIAANGGEKEFNYRNFRRNKIEIFEIIEKLVDVIVDRAWEQNNFFQECVEHMVLAKGDRNEFVIPTEADFIVCDTADGINTPRRQRLNVGTWNVPTHIHVVRMYDEFTRFMAGRIDWPTLCNKVAAAFVKDTWLDIYTALEGINEATRGMAATVPGTYVKTGTYDEGTLLELIGHVEAATGIAPVIVGTATALRNLTITPLADQGKDELYNQGYCGKFYGYNTIKVPQIHKPGKDEFVLNDNIIHVIAGDKFIKFVEKGEAYILDKDGTTNADRTVEYLMEREYGVGILVTGHCYGKYTLATE